jgi:hypothetical protein
LCGREQDRLQLMRISLGGQNAMSLTSKKRQVFLSHSGRDAHRALELAAKLEKQLAELGYPVEVFNTSEPEHRYKALHELLTAGEDWRSRAEQYEEELRRYLRQNLQESSAFVALVTPQSVRAASKVIEFEIEAARSAAVKNQRAFFFPCVADGARVQDLPPGAREFQGVDLNGEGGLTRLAEAVCRALSEDLDR